ncbi:MAG: phosphate ABC transporter substrate-binding protein PstS [Odoribacter sp.]
MNKLFIFIFILSLAACGNSKKKDASSAGKIDLAGAGATFPLPYYNLAFKTYQDSTGVSVTYGGIGSGGGIRSLKDQIVDFAGSDAFLTDKEISSMPAPVIHIPTCMGAIVLAYHLTEVKDLKLTGDLVADIFLGKITHWNDARIQSVNPGAVLPDKTIHPIYRSDGSGTTYVFSDYLAKVSSDWEQTVGRGKALKWPAGIAAKGNPGVAGTISQTSGAIGYIGSEYAFALKIPVAKLQNQAGNFILPTTESISAAAGIDIPADTRTMITDSPAVEAYPISCFTWIIIYQEQAYGKRSPAEAEATVALLNWLTNPLAQEITTKVHYSPLPASAIANAKMLLKSVTYNGQTILK